MPVDVDKVSFPIAQFSDCLGNPLSNGHVVINLSKDCISPLGQVSAGQKIVLQLDNNGTLGTNPAGFWPTSALTPTDSVYLLRAYSASGELSYGPQSFVAEDIMQVSTVTLSSAQVKTLKASPVQLIASPGAGKGIFLVACHFEYIPGAVGYTLPDAGTLLVAYNAGFGSTFYLHVSQLSIVLPIANTSVFDVTGLVGVISQQLNEYVSMPKSFMENQGILISHSQNPGGGPAASSGEITLGDGSIRVTSYYVVVTLGI